MFRTLRRKIFRLALVSGAGAAANYFLDKERGEKRREQAKVKADTVLKRATPGAAWEPERTANVFDTPASTPPSPAPSVAAPVMTDVVVTPERETDPLATGPLTTDPLTTGPGPVTTPYTG